MLLADSEKVAQQWLLPLKILVAAGSAEMKDSVQDGAEVSTGPVRRNHLAVLNINIRFLTFASNISVNRVDGNNCLHILADFRVQDSESLNAMLKMASWLCDHGCPLGTVNSSNQIPADVAGKILVSPHSAPCTNLVLSHN